MVGDWRAGVLNDSDISSPAAAAVAQDQVSRQTAVVRTATIRANAVWLALSLVAAVGVIACGDDDTASSIGAVSDNAVIEYHYGDASVPPQFHRSYLLTITRTSVRGVVDSYGNELADETAAIPSEVWNGLVAQLDDLADLDVDKGEGCTGGTSRSLTVVDGNTTRLDLAFDVCGDANAPAAKRLDDAIKPVTEQIPNWAEFVS